MPHWDRPFQLHTDESELGAGAVLTPIHEGSERVLGHACHWWSGTDARRPPTEREAVAVLWAVDHFRPYVWGRRFTLFTDCLALTWLFKNRDLFTCKLHRWALRRNKIRHGSAVVAGHSPPTPGCLVSNALLEVTR